MKTLLAFITLLLACSAEAQFKANPFTTNGPLARAEIAVGDSLLDNGYWYSGYPAPASGIGNDLMGRLLQQSNFLFHGPYLNIASNNATIWQWNSNGFFLRTALTNALSAYGSKAHTTVLLGANDLDGNGTNFTTLTNQYGLLYALIKSYGGGLTVISPVTNSSGSAAYNTNRLAVKAWQKSVAGTALLDEVIDSDSVLTNSAQFVDNQHPNSIGNTNLAVAYNAATRFTNLFSTISRGNENLKANTVEAELVTARGLASTDFLTKNLALNLQFVPSGTYGYIFALSSLGAFRPVLVRGNPLQLLGGASSGTIVIDQAGLPVTSTFSFDVNGHSYFESNTTVGGFVSNSTTAATIYFGTTNNPTFPAAAGSIYSFNGATAAGMFLHTNSSIATSWYPVKLN